MVSVEVGHRVIALVPVHVDHDTVERADTRHGSTVADQSAAKRYPPGAREVRPFSYKSWRAPAQLWETETRHPICTVDVRGAYDFRTALNITQASPHKCTFPQVGMLRGQRPRIARLEMATIVIILSRRTCYDGSSVRGSMVTLLDWAEFGSSDAPLVRSSSV